MIPFLDLKKQYSNLETDLNKAIKAVLISTDFINGSEVLEIERKISDFSGTKYAIGVNSCTDALFIALKSIGIQKGDEVITTPFSFIATSEVIEALGAKPIFVDIDPDSYNIDPKLIEQKITNKTRAIIPVHLFGQPCEMEEIIEISQKYNLKVIEDAAQSFGAEYKGQKVGSIGDIGCYSFFPSKNLGAYGDAGMIISNSEKLTEQAKAFKSHGSKTKYYYELLGVNSRLDTIQAAVLNVKMNFIEKWLQERRKIAYRYNKAFNGISELILPNEIPNSYSVYNQYTVRVLNVKRDLLRERLKSDGIETMIYYPVPLHLQKVHDELNHKNGDFPVAEKASQELVSLPIYPELNEKDQEYIIDKVKSFFADN